MGIFSLSSFIILVGASFLQQNVLGGNSLLTSGGIYEGDSGEFEYHPENSGSGESAQIIWERNKETINPTTTTEFPSTPKPPFRVSSCPLDSKISPCTCKFDPIYGAQILCSGSAVNQSSIENTFREIRRVNKIPEDRGILISEFVLDTTELTLLDLAPFYGSKLCVLKIQLNSDLTKLVTSGNPRDHGTIHAASFELFYSPINKQGFGDTLKYFSSEMTDFVAGTVPLGNDSNSNNNNNSFERESEFLPGFSALINLGFLSLQNCGISGRLDSGYFNFHGLKNPRIIYIGLDNIKEIGENVFNFDGPGFQAIDLTGNKLKESSFHPNSGITRPGRKTSLGLFDNQITTLPTLIFESFLDAHPQNVLELNGNPLICDERLGWIKSRREEFELGVTYANCVNDPGHNIFDSDLIP